MIVGLIWDQSYCSHLRAVAGQAVPISKLIQSHIIAPWGKLHENQGTAALLSHNSDWSYSLFSNRRVWIRLHLQTEEGPGLDWQSLELPTQYARFVASLLSLLLLLHFIYPLLFLCVPEAFDTGWVEYTKGGGSSICYTKACPRTADIEQQVLALNITSCLPFGVCCSLSYLTGDP